jgi:hypothetical protein
LNFRSLDIPEWLSRLAAIARLRTLLSRQIEVADVDISANEITFLKFAQLLVDLFADGQLKQLNLHKKVSPTIPQTLDNFQQGLCLLVNSLPKLVHLQIDMRLSHRNDFNCMEMESWLSTESKSKLARPVHWRCRSFMIDLWL